MTEYYTCGDQRTVSSIQSCQAWWQMPSLTSPLTSPSLSLSILPGKKDTKARETTQWVKCRPHRRGNLGLGPQLGEGHTVGGRSNQVDARTG